MTVISRFCQMAICYVSGTQKTATYCITFH